MMIVRGLGVGENMDKIYNVNNNNNNNNNNSNNNSNNNNNNNNNTITATPPKFLTLLINRLKPQII